jgi:hypothetical protein
MPVQAPHCEVQRVADAVWRCSRRRLWAAVKPLEERALTLNKGPSKQLNWTEYDFAFKKRAGCEAYRDLRGERHHACDLLRDRQVAVIEHEERAWQIH